VLPHRADRPPDRPRRARPLPGGAARRGDGAEAEPARRRAVRPGRGGLPRRAPVMEAAPEVTAYVGLGANAGDRAAALRAAVAALDATEGVRVERVSPVYETEAHRLPGQPPQPDHLNAVARLRTDLAPDVLLDVFRTLEKVAGRDPEAPRWSPRPLDLDLLLYGDLVLDAPA